MSFSTASRRLVIFLFLFALLCANQAFSFTAAEQAQITEGCKLALALSPKSMSEKGMLNVVKNVTGKKEASLVSVCKRIATDFATDYNKNRDMLDSLGSGKNSPDLFNPPGRKCMVEVNGQLQESPGNCNVGCLSWIDKQPDKFRRIGFHAGHQVVFQIGRYNMSPGSGFAQDLAVCLEGSKADRFQCLQSSCVPAYRTYTNNPTN